MAVFIWRDGEARLADGAVAMATDRGLTLGDALFETFPAFGGKPFLQEAHLDRLMASSGALFFKTERNICEALISKALNHHGSESIILRLEVTRGVGARGLHIDPQATPSYYLVTSPWSQTFIEGSLSVGTSPIRRSETSPSSFHKTANYLDNITALEAAKRAGFDDAILLNSQGHLACTTTGNLFAVKGKTLHTPAITCGVLNGITRRTVLQIGQELGFEIEEGSFLPEAFWHADCIFITNSARLLIPVRRTGAHSFASDPMPETYLTLKKALFDLVETKTGFMLESHS